MFQFVMGWHAQPGESLYDMTSLVTQADTGGDIVTTTTRTTQTTHHISLSAKLSEFTDKVGYPGATMI